MVGCGSGVLLCNYHCGKFAVVAFYHFLNANVQCTVITHHTLAAHVLLLSHLRGSFLVALLLKTVAFFVEKKGAKNPTTTN
jgi:hypothetical protein